MPRDMHDSGNSMNSMEATVPPKISLAPWRAGPWPALGGFLPRLRSPHARPSQQQRARPNRGWPSLVDRVALATAVCCAPAFGARWEHATIVVLGAPRQRRPAIEREREDRLELGPGLGHANGHHPGVLATEDNLPRLDGHTADPVGCVSPRRTSGRANDASTRLGFRAHAPTVRHLGPPGQVCRSSSGASSAARSTR